MILLAMSLVYDVHTPRFRPEIMSPRWLHVRCCVTAAIQQKPSTILPNSINIRHWELSKGCPQWARLWGSNFDDGTTQTARDLPLRAAGSLGEAASLGLPYHRAECGTFKVKERYNLVSILFGARLYRLNATPKRHTARLIRRCEAGFSSCLRVAPIGHTAEGPLRRCRWLTARSSSSWQCEPLSVDLASRGRAITVTAVGGIGVCGRRTAEGHVAVPTASGT